MSLGGENLNTTEPFIVNYTEQDGDALAVAAGTSYVLNEVAQTEAIPTTDGNIIITTRSKTPDFEIGESGVSMSRIDTYNIRQGRYINTTGLQLVDHGSPIQRVEIPHDRNDGINFEAISQMSNEELDFATRALARFNY